MDLRPENTPSFESSVAVWGLRFGSKHQITFQHFLNGQHELFQLPVHEKDINKNEM